MGADPRCRAPLPTPARARRLLLPLAVAGLAACAATRPDGAMPASLVGDVSTRHVGSATLARDPARPVAEVLGTYWQMGAPRDPRNLKALVGDESVGVYAGSTYLGGWDYLRTMRSGEVLRVQRLTPTEAFFRYGRRHANGAVVLTLRTGPSRR